MSAECFRVEVGEGARLTGFTVGGRSVVILPGEYHVHRLTPKVPLRPCTVALRFVGAYRPDEDVHVEVPAGMNLIDALPVGVKVLGHSGHTGT